jgi:hypothetical protein
VFVNLSNDPQNQLGYSLIEASVGRNGQSMRDLNSILDRLEVYYSMRYSPLAIGSNGRTKAPF